MSVACQHGVSTIDSERGEPCLACLVDDLKAQCDQALRERDEALSREQEAIRDRNHQASAAQRMEHERNEARKATREIVDYTRTSYVSQLTIDLWAERWPWLQEEKR